MPSAGAKSDSKREVIDGQLKKQSQFGTAQYRIPNTGHSMKKQSQSLCQVSVIPAMTMVYGYLYARRPRRKKANSYAEHLRQFCGIIRSVAAGSSVLSRAYSKEPAYTLPTFHHHLRAISWENLISRMTMKDVTRILAAINQGDAKAACELLPSVSERLRASTKHSQRQSQHK